MDSKPSHQWRSQLLTGLTLIAIGAGFLADRLGFFDMRDLWHYSPLLLVLFGVNRFFGDARVKDIIGGIWMIFIGLWLFAMFDGWLDISWHSTWPFFVIFWGATEVLKGILNNRSKE